jgi:hypothetical protein
MDHLFDENSVHVELRRGGGDASGLPKSAIPTHFVLLKAGIMTHLELHIYCLSDPKQTNILYKNLYFIFTSYIIRLNKVV